MPIDHFSGNRATTQLYSIQYHITFVHTTSNMQSMSILPLVFALVLCVVSIDACYGMRGAGYGAR